MADTLSFQAWLFDFSPGPSVSDWGFQLTVLDSLNQPFGELILQDSARTQLSAGITGRQYVSQTAEGSHNDQYNGIVWEFGWVRPPGPPRPDTLRFHISSVLANGDHTSTGDDVVTDTIDVRVCHLQLAGDVNNNNSLTSADIITVLKYVFKGGVEPMPCAANGDVNCSNAVTSADVIWLVNHIFKDGPPPCDICALIFDGTWFCY